MIDDRYLQVADLVAQLAERDYPNRWEGFLEQMMQVFYCVVWRGVACMSTLVRGAGMERG